MLYQANETYSDLHGVVLDDTIQIVSDFGLLHLLHQTKRKGMHFLCE